MAIKWNKAPDVKRKIDYLAGKVGIEPNNKASVYCYRSTGSKSRAIARIWGLSRLWQEVLKQKPAYIIEIISERFDRASPAEKERVLLHELAHIPNNFSGALVPHIKRGKRSFRKKLDRLILKLL